MSYVPIAWAVISTLRQDELQRSLHAIPWADKPAAMMVAVLLLRVKISLLGYGKFLVHSGHTGSAFSMSDMGQISP